MKTSVGGSANDLDFLDTGTPDDKVIMAVQNGQADAGFIRSGYLETLSRNKKLNIEDFKIINRQRLPSYPFAVSTHLIPEWPVCAMPSVSQEVTKLFVLTLLEYHRYNPGRDLSILTGFSLAQDYQSVEEIMMEMKIPPFDHVPRLSLGEIWTLYKQWISLFLILFVWLLIVSLALFMSRKALANATDQFIKAMDSSEDGLFDWNLITNEMYRSPGWKKMLGYRPDEVMERQISPWEDLIHEEDRQVFMDELTQILRREKDVFQVNIRLQHRDGHWIEVLSRASAYFDKKGKAIRIVGTNVDVTKIKKAEQEIARMQKLEGLGSIAGGIAHDFNNLFSGIYGNIELIRANIHNPEKAGKFLQILLNSMSTAKRLTGRLLTFSKGGQMQIETVDLTALIQETVRLNLTGSNVRVTMDFDEQLHSISADTSQIEQVMSNLILNASQAMPNGGELFISGSNEEDISSYLPGQSGPCVRINIRDNGPGIDEDVMPYIFDPYFTTKQFGHGLGLAICQSIIHKHHGQIFAASEEDGAVFTVILPARTDTARNTAIAEEEAAELLPDTMQEDKTRILFLDDDPAIRTINSLFLEDLGFSVDAVADGSEAVRYFEANLRTGNRYGLLIFDLTIPGGMGGLEALNQIRKIYQSDAPLKAIISSGYSNNQVITEYHKFGFTDVLKKPFTMDEMKEKIFRALAL